MTIPNADRFQDINSRIGHLQLRLANFELRLSQLDAYLDTIEERLTDVEDDMNEPFVDDSNTEEDIDQPTRAAQVPDYFFTIRATSPIEATRKATRKMEAKGINNFVGICEALDSTNELYAVEIYLD